jgi:hypothetical protein
MARMPPTPPTLTVHADRAVSAGEQIFETYGDNSNEIYFRHHGFVPDENPCVTATHCRAPTRI